MNSVGDINKFIGEDNLTIAETMRKIDINSLDSFIKGLK